MAIQYPIVLDSPNNVEADDEKEKAFLEYLLSNSDHSSQFIMSGIGFDSAEFQANINKPMNVIILTNDKYHLLQTEDYVSYSSLMEELCNAE